MSQIIKLTEQEKERAKAFYGLFKTNPSQITDEMRNDLRQINQKAWNIAKEKTLSIQERSLAHDTIKYIHEIFGMKYDDNWRPKEYNGTARGSWSSSKEQRTKNCNEFVSFVGNTVWNSLTPYEMATILSTIWGTVKQ